MGTEETPDRRDDTCDEDGAVDGLGPDSALVTRHAALKELDRALFQARRALDRALDRPPDAEPPTDLPYKELRRLADELQLSASKRSEPARARIQELLDSDEKDGSDEAPRPSTVAGVAPSGKLRSD